MKRFFTLIFIFSFFLSFAQPNPGFEDWEMEFGQESPIGWQTTNFLCAFPLNAPSAIKASGIDKHSGNYALKIKSVHLVSNPAPNILSDTLGAAFTGTINLSPLYLKRGYPFSERPEKLNIWYKYFPVGNDDGTIGALLTKWNGVKRDTLAIADSLIHYSPTYSLLQVNFNYFSDEIPDSATIVLLSSTSTAGARVNSTLFVDDVSFSGWVGMNDYNKKNRFSMYPNPSKDELHFKFNSDEKLKINIIDATGNLLITSIVSDRGVTIDTRNYCSGIYYYEITDEKNSPITRGKFTVVQ